MCKARSSGAHTDDAAPTLVYAGRDALSRDRAFELWRRQATVGCDERFGRCLNISGLPVHGYDQNGTCACHHWFIGGDCSQPDLSGDICELHNDDGSLQARGDSNAASVGLVADGGPTDLAFGARVRAGGAST